MKREWTYNDDPVYVLGRCVRYDEGIVGYDIKMRPKRLGRGEYTFVGTPDFTVDANTGELYSDVYPA